jgi:MFS family permease
VFFGIVSLFGDMVYEGARGLIPQYLSLLGATALLVGAISGLGDFTGYAIRFLSGFIADTTRAYWILIFLGYSLIVALPLLSLPTGLALAVILILLERLGKGLRQPPRDTILSVVSKEVGSGKAFGLHEFLDQTGALAGPLLVAGAMYYTSNNYHFAFGLLFVPFLFVLLTLTFVYRRVHAKLIVSPVRARGLMRDLGKPFYMYTVAVTMNALGLIPYALILYEVSLHAQAWIGPLVYLLIQGVDAVSALVSGRAYDRFGLKFLTLAFTISIFTPLLVVFNNGLSMLMIASILFGTVQGMQESIYRAAVSDLTSESSRGTAYGIFNTGCGLGLLASGIIFGTMIFYNLPLIVVLPYVVVLQACSIAIVWRVCKGSQHPRTRARFGDP